MTEHTVKAFDQDLEAIDSLIRGMGLLAADMLEKSTGGLSDAASVPVDAVRRLDQDMDRMQREIDDRAVRLIAMRQPMAQDLRAIIGAIRNAGEFERIGDLAKNIARRLNAVGTEAEVLALARRLDGVSQLAQDQIRSLVELYTARNAAELEALRDRDEKIDAAYLEVFRQVLAFIRENPAHAVSGTHLLFCAKNLERIGDHVTNIAENVYYTLTGDQLSVTRPKRKEFTGDAAL